MSKDLRSTKEKVNDLLENEYQNYRHWDGMFYSFIQMMKNKDKVITIGDLEQLKESMFRKQERYCKKLNEIRPELNQILDEKEKV